ncbi:acetyl-CoA synthetase-like protein [Anaeromyces robustus]|uniref:Acetyl-CoA synthetase-like protein n=1 Tax=Anaeromyces robustus TaxID=1754192 RepID=A0A1Y1WVQ1_9FUNG|nr:acetyl-CoA synthetase-like protein [Anaeromyces robustus]|eukprot:ORX77639.1 acetyl-CoA synthetase-like protein [Anaeromyces robustus]
MKKMDLMKNSSNCYSVIGIQEHIYYNYFNDKDKNKYIIYKKLQLKENLDINKLKNGILKLFQKHENLRAKFYEDEVDNQTKIFRCIDNDCQLKFEDLSDENINEFLSPFDLWKAPLIRVGFISDKFLLLSFHRIIADEESVKILINELTHYYYDGLINDSKPQFKDYVLLKEDKDKFFFNNDFNTLKSLFDCEYTTLNLTIKKYKNNDENKNINVKKCSKIIDSNDYEIINNFIKSNNLNKKIYFICVYGYIMYKYSGQTRVYSSIFDSTRNNNTENIFGPISKVQPVLMKYEDNITMMNVYQEVKDIILGFENNEISYFDLEKQLNLKELSNCFSFDSDQESNMKIFEKLFDNINNNYDYDENHDYFLFLNKLFKFNLIFKVSDLNDHYKISIDYDGRFYDEFLINNMINNYINVVKCCNNFYLNINDIEYISTEEMNRILNVFNQKRFEKIEEKIYHVEFSKQLKEYSNNCAIVFNNKKYTYEQVEKMSNSLAHYLRSIGVKRNDIIPLICNRSHYFIIAAIGIMKSGAAYLPIDPDFPEERIQYIVDEVNAKFLLFYLSHEKNGNNNDKKIFSKNPIMSIDLELHDYNKNINSIDNINEGNDLCGIYYTSGTSGKPKGAMITHNNIINLCIYNLTNDGTSNDFIMEEFSNIISIAKITFVMSIVEIFYSLLHNKCVILCNDDEFNNPTLLGNLIKNYHADFMNSTPSRINKYLNDKSFRESFLNIKSLILGGEKITKVILSNITKHLDKSCHIYCGYGQTECTVDCTIGRVNIEDILYNNKEITNGKPSGNNEVYILDDDLKPVPIGVEGNVYISSNGVNIGYINNKTLTNEKFINCPFNSKKMYQTGDLGKWSYDGNLICTGRKDFQVKIYGIRIELSEIDNTIKEMKEIDYSVTINKTNLNGETRLICYYISKSDIQEKDFRNYLVNKLPIYMIPSYYIKIDKIPITSHGKLDRRSLPDPFVDIKKLNDIIVPETDIEKKLCNIYGNVLNIDIKNIGKNSDFNDLGGDSINATKIINLIEKELHIKIDFKTILMHPIISDLSKYIEEKIDSNKNKDWNEIENEITIKHYNKKSYPITSQQLGIYVDSIKYGNSTVYNIPFSYKLKKNLDIEKIKEGFKELIRNNDVLRSKYLPKEIDGKTKIYGFIDDECSLIFEEYTYESVRKFVRPFDLSKAPLIRVGFIGNEVLLIDMHHIISDGTTMSIIINGINKYYNELELTELEVQFSDYAIHMNEMKNSEVYFKQIEFYKEMFKEDYEITNIPQKEEINEYDVNKKVENGIGNCEKIIDSSLSKRINEYIRVNRISKTAFFISIYGYILSKYSGQDNIYTSMMSANRNNHYVENMIDILKENMKILMELYNNQDISFSELLNTLKLKKVSNAFIFQPKSIVENINSDKSIFSDGNIININILNEESNEIQLNNDNTTKFDITFSIIEKEKEYIITVDYNKRIYELSMIEKIMNKIEYIPKEEMEKVINKFNNDNFTYDCDKIYHVEFSRIAEEKPESTALIFNNEKYKYRELDEMSNSLAHYLRECGIKRNDIVPIISKRSPYYVIASVAVSKAGGAFLPIDVKFPIERIKFILNDVKPKLILTYDVEEIVKNLEQNPEYNIYNINNHNYNKNKMSIENINKPEDTCYVLFTSGTTGKPKGALVSHFNIYNFIRKFDNDRNNINIYDIIVRKNSITNMLAIANFPFDLYHIEITFSLIHGLTIVLADEKLIENTNSMGKYIKENQIEFITTTPTRFKLFMENEEFRNHLKQIKVLIFIGEALPLNLCKEIHQCSKCKIYNSYGPTECSVTCTIKEIDTEKENKVSIGKPMCNCKVYILDKNQKPVPIGVVGYIYIGGFGVGKGYLGRPKLTKENFVNCPYNNYSNSNIEEKYDENTIDTVKKMYNTGDLGKWMNNGEIEYLGRADFQVKIKGHRIELGEIENTIKEINEIEHCAIIDSMNKNEEKYLICYYTMKNPSTDSSSNQGKKIREYLKSKLPIYMVPNYFKLISELPITRNGKLDRKALPEPEIEDIVEEEFIKPKNKIEEKICEIYSKIFNINKSKIGRTQDFLELGGDSLQAIRVATYIEKEFLVKIYMKDVLSHTIIYDLGKFIENKINSNIENENESFGLIEIKKFNYEEYPITSQQMGIYIDSIKNPNSIIYNIPRIFHFNKPVDIEKIKKGFEILFDKQIILRSKFITKVINGKTEIYGHIDDKCLLMFEEYTYENVKTFVRPFDLSKAPLIRVGFIGNEVLLIDMHHIISDGTTMSIIINEINKFYNGLQISELDVQFSNYAVYINEMKNSELYSKQLEFYKEMFKEDYEITNIPQKERINEYSLKENKIGKCIKVIDNSTSKIIDEFIRINRISKSVFFISIYGCILSKYSGQEIIYTSMMNANRTNYYVENMIGMFVSTQPILLKYDKEYNSFLDILKVNMELLMELYNNQDISFSELVNTLKLKKVNNAFIFQPKSIIENNESDESIFSNEDIQTTYTLYEESNEIQLNNDNTAKFDITFSVIEREEGYSFIIEYNQGIYEVSLIENIMNSYIEIIKWLDKFNNNIKEIEYIPKEEKEKIINKFNNNVFEYDCNKLYHVEFSQVAKENENKIAIVCNGIEISYSELDKMSNSLGHYMREHDIGRGDIIPIICERSIYFVIGALAIMKSGAAYLPIDPDYPEERIKFMVEEVQSKMILEYVTNKENRLKLQNHEWNIYSLSEHNYEDHIEEINNINESDDLCYVLFTSGTTGKPKGTMITHNNIINYCLYSQTYNGKNMFGSTIENSLAISKFTFDISIGEIYLPLLIGSRVIICNDNEYNNPILIGNLIKKGNVDFMIITPTRMENYIKNKEFKDSLRNIKWMYMGAEVLNPKLLKNIIKSTNAVIYNAYGPTETTVNCTLKQLTYGNNNEDIDNIKINIGKPLCNCKIYILDETFKPVPIGVVGEIFISGYGVGKGYLNQPELTKKMFIECPYYNINGNPCTMYRTGDLGKWNEEGEIVCLGRIDFQVKIRGQRIELSEIENTIKEMKGIEYSTVIDRKYENGNKYLVCYFISENIINGNEIRRYLKSKLPSYMIPTYFVKIGNLPVTSNGKLDRKSLPEPNIKNLNKEEYVAPETEIEKIICKIYSQVFNIDINEIGRYNDFYELGGDSFNVIQVYTLMEKEFKIKVNMRDIFSNTVIYDLGQFINKKINANEESENESYDLNEIEKCDCKEYPITSQQMGVYIDSIKNPNSIIYNIPEAFKLIKSIDIEKVKNGFSRLFKKQDVLRSKYIEKEINGKTEIYGIIDDECLLKFEEYTYDNYKTFVRPFDLSKAPLIRVGFIENEVLLIDIHHIISDGTTMSIIRNEINKYYNGLELTELEVQFSDYAIHMNEMKSSELYSKQLEFYKEMFKEDYEITNIPQKEKITVYNGEFKDVKESKENEIGYYIKTIDQSMSDKINEYLRINKISKTAFFISIYGYILSKYSGQDIIYTSMMSANRNNHYVENMIGMFVSTQPILLKYDKSNISFLDIIKENMELLIELYNNQDISFSEMVNTLKLKKFNNAFIFQPKSITEDSPSNKSIFLKEENEMIYTLYQDNKELQLNNENNTKFDILFNAIEKEKNYIFSIEYNNKIYESIMIENIMNSFIEFVEHIDIFNENIKEIDYIPKEEKEKIINKFNDNNITFDCDKIYHVEFSRIAKEKPESIALIFNNEKYKYRELDEMSNSLAHYLRECGIKRNDIVPIISERSPYYVIASVAVSKAGGAYLPIDVKFPIERIKFILNDVKSKLILTYDVEEIVKNLEQNPEYNIYNINDHDYSKNKMSIENINKSEDTCYVLFTSGTTGKPKGALVSHFNIYNYLRKFENDDSCLSMYNILMEDNIQNILAITKFSFDIAHNEITYCLIHGLTIVLVDEELSEDVTSLSTYILNNKVDLINTTPSRIKLFMENEEFKKILKTIKVMIFSGEELPYNLCKYIHQYSKCKIINGYGPTECYFVTFKEIKEDTESTITIGKPICNCKIYILDKSLNPVPIGVEGEIYIGGYCVGKGYLNREELTNEKFIECPFRDEDMHNQIMYKTGDLGKWTAEGDIDYIGRIDFQVKINGQRIELGEIENILNEYSLIKYSVVIDKVNEEGNKYLICYYQSDSEITGEEIREYLTTKIPKYMIPNYYIRVNNFPVTSNGKLDRKALPEPNIEDRIKEVYVKPETEVERFICKIYSSIFNIDINNVGRTTNFYDIGGNSLNAIRVKYTIEKEMNVKINIKDILTYIEVKDLAKCIESIVNKDRNENKSLKYIHIDRRYSKEYPITSQQMGVYIDSIKNPNSIIYNLPRALQLNKSINIERIKEGFEMMLYKQEILRSKFIKKEIDGKTEIYGYIDDECSLLFEEYTYDNCGMFVRPFDLSKSPLIRVGFIGNEVLLIDMHHIISDGTTMSIIINEINKYYKELELTELEFQFSDYAIHMNEMKSSELYSKQLEFYKEMFKEDYEITSIPQKEKLSEFNINGMEESKIGNCFNDIDQHMSDKINEYLRVNRISKTAFFISIYGYILCKYSGQEIIYTSMMSANRNNHYVENMIGMFVSTQPILLKYDKLNNSFLDIIKENMEILMELYNNQDISFSELVNTLKLKKVNNAFIFQPKSIIENNESDETIFTKEEMKKNYTLYEESNNFLLNIDNKTKFDITFNVIESERGYSFMIEYNERKYESSLIENIMNSYIEIIKWLDKFNNNIKEIEYIPKEEKEKIINKFNNNVFEYDCNKLYHVEFSQVAKENENKIAIVCNGIEISYSELDKMSNSLGHYMREHDIGRGDIIPIICERSIYFVIGALVIMKSGAAYLPIDPDYPEERIKFMVEEVQSKMILEYVTNKENRLKLQNHEWNIYSLSEHNYEDHIEEINNINESDDLCYVLFTSGTTGKPKGTMITHNNLINYCLYTQTNNGEESIFYRKINNILSFTKFTHDISIGEINFALLNGSKIILCNEDEYNDPIKLGKLISKYYIDYIFSVPTRLEVYINYEEFYNSLKYVKILMLGGEKLNINFVKKLRIFENLNIYNVYGPTETTVVSNIKDLNEYKNKYNSEIEENSVGKPLCNFNMYILDKTLKPVPIGVVGEIFISGYGVGKGYLNQPELTKKMFIECPYHNINGNPCTMYRTGDLGKWNEEGEIVCLGRIDFQIKIRGQRIELSEIENTIKEIEGIEYSTVIDREHDNGDKYLVCYFISENIINGNEIRRYLKNKLPSYMIPNYFIKLDYLPVTSNGKLDRKSLPKPNIKELMKESYSSPENEIEEKICEIYSEIFNIDINEIGRNNDFYELGGNSFNAIRICNLIEKVFMIKINMRDIFSHSIIYEFGKFIDNKIKERNEKENEIYNIIEIKKRNSKEYPITSQQMEFILIQLRILIV